MLCATIAENTVNEAIRVGRRARKWCNILELRIDCLNNPDRFPELLERLPGPFVATCRSVKHGGEFRGSKQKRLKILSRAARRGVDYIDVEHDVEEERRKKIGGTQILSYHNFERTPLDLDDLLAKFQNEYADYIKISTYCNTLDDAIRLMELEPGGTRPVILLGMGDYGRITRILYRKTHSLMTYGAANPEQPGAPGQISVEELARVYNIQRVDQSTEVYALIGDPVSHSRSPQLFNALFEEHNLNAIYIPVRMVQTSTLPRLIQDIDLEGASVTIPHKRAVIPYLDAMNPYAEQIGAVNTIARVNSRLEGYNTDAQAALESILNNWPGDDVSPDQEKPLEGKSVFLIGAGGAARAVATALINAGADLSITNRTEERGRDLSEEFEARFVKWEDRADVESPDLLVNATSAGMEPIENVTPFPGDWLHEDTVVFDMVYTPAETRLLKEAREAGCDTITGTDMFARQALRQFRLWTGIHVSPEEIPDLL